MAQLRTKPKEMERRQQEEFGVFSKYQVNHSGLGSTVGGQAGCDPTHHGGISWHRLNWQLQAKGPLPATSTRKPGSRETQAQSPAPPTVPLATGWLPPPLPKGRPKGNREL